MVAQLPHEVRGGAFYRPNTSDLLEVSESETDKFAQPTQQSGGNVILSSYHRNEITLAAFFDLSSLQEDVMGLGKGALLWLIGIPLPIIILLAIFMHH
jgi:hypothetical protein